MKRGAEILSPREIEAAAAQWVARRDAGLTGAAQAELGRWLAADARHDAAFRFYQSTWSALAQPARSGAAKRFTQEIATLAVRRRRRRVVALGGALAVLLALRFGTLERAVPAREPTRSSAVVTTPVRQTLPDGTVVELKGHAHIAVDFVPGWRRVNLSEGEAYFAVAKDSKRPFVVSAGGVEVRAVGTAFSVQLGTTAVEVLVTDGTVAVAKATDATRTSAASNPAVLATVSAGNRVTVDRVSTAPAEVMAVPADESDAQLAWRRPRVEFTRTPLAEAVALLNQHVAPTATRLVVADPALAAMCVTGVFRADNTAAFVMLLEGAFGVKAERTGSTIVLRRASVSNAPE